jgi:hypothetical protein
MGRRRHLERTTRVVSGSCCCTARTEVATVDQQLRLQAAHGMVSLAVICLVCRLGGYGLVCKVYEAVAASLPSGMVSVAAARHPLATTAARCHWQANEGKPVKQAGPSWAVTQPQHCQCSLHTSEGYNMLKSKEKGVGPSACCTPISDIGSTSADVCLTSTSRSTSADVDLSWTTAIIHVQTSARHQTISNDGNHGLRHRHQS